MKIVYGLSGQGFGHSTRSKETLSHLKEAGHEIKVLTYGQSLFFLSEGFDILEIPGLTLAYSGNRLHYRKTLFDNLKNFSKLAAAWRSVSAEIKKFQPDLAITDFEPMTAMIARRQKLPLISIDNQHQLTDTRIELPLKYRKDLLLDKLIIRFMVSGAKKYLVTSFFKTIPRNSKTEIFPPIIRKEVLDLKPAYGDYILVYEGADLKKIIPLLQESGLKFVVFGPHREGIEGNITFKKFNVDEWLQYLAGAKAVIGTGGASLMSECVCLKKPYLVLPIKRQIEQVINAFYLKKLGYGECSFGLTKGVFEKFISSLPEYQENLSTAPGAGNELLFERLDEIIDEIKNGSPKRAE